MVGATYVSCVKQIPPSEEWDGRDHASFCLIHVNEVNIQGQKTLKIIKVWPRPLFWVLQGYHTFIYKNP